MVVTLGIAYTDGELAIYGNSGDTIPLPHLYPEADLERIICLTIVFSLFISGCSSLFGFGPEQAAIYHLVNTESSLVEFAIVPDSVRADQSQPWQDTFIVLVTFNSLEAGVNMNDCLALIRVRQIEDNWSSNMVAICCWTAGSEDVYQVCSGQSDSPANVDLSYLSGAIYDDRIAAFDVLWEDGLRGEYPTVNRTLLVLRGGIHEPAQIRPLDPVGRLVE